MLVLLPTLLWYEIPDLYDLSCFHIFCQSAQSRIRSKETRRFSSVWTLFLIPRPFRDQDWSSSSKTQKPCEYLYHDRLRWQILDQRCNSRASRNVGSKMLVVYVFCFFFVEISGLATGLIRLPRQPWRRGHWSSMFPLKSLPTVGKSRRLRCWNEIPVVGDCFITHGVLQLLLESFRESLKCNREGTREASLWDAAGQTSVIFSLPRTVKCFLGYLTKYSNEPLAFSLHKAQLKVKDKFFFFFFSAAEPSRAPLPSQNTRKV